MKTTERGFGIYAELTDTKGAHVRVQQSSSADGPHVWLFAKGGRTVSNEQKRLAKECRDRKFAMPGDQIITDDTSAHLSPEQAREIAKALLAFADEHS